MTYPERMLKVRIIAPKAKLSSVINTLYNLGLCHITPHLKGKYELDIGEPLADAETLSALLLSIRNVLSRFPSVEASHHLPPLSKKTLETAKQGITKLYADLQVAETEKKEIAVKQEQLQRLLFIQEALQAFSLDFSLLQHSRALCYYFGTVKEPTQAKRASYQPMTSSGQFLFEIQKKLPTISLQQKGNFILAVGRRGEEAKIQAALLEAGFTALPLPSSDAKEYHKNKSELQKLQERKSHLQKKLKNIELQLPILKALEQQFEEEIRKQELPLSFAVTQKTFIAEGWIPAKDQPLVTAQLKQNVKGAVHLEFKDPEKEDNPPVKMRNKRLITPFEFFLRLYDLPMYKELDPTSLVFITFPIFFGFMLGDVGYGLVLLATFYFIKKKVPVAKDLAGILIFAALLSVLFGFVFGEFFGFEHVSESTGAALCEKAGFCLERVAHETHGKTEMIYEFPRLFSRVESHVTIFGYEILTVLAVGAVIGFIHLNLGFIIGFINEFARHGFWHALLAKGSWMMIELGAILSILSAIHLLQPFMILVGIGVALLGLIFLGKEEGVQGLAEIPALISNTLSYMRLGAVGLAGVGLAIVINEKLGIPFIEKGGVFVVIGILIMLLGHAINILLGVIGPFLHGVRLHYVEFFSKFFHGGGEEFSPFSQKITEHK